MTTTFADPGAPGGDKLPLAELNGALLLIEPLEALHNVQTTFGMTDPVRANVHALDGTNAGQVYDDTLIFPKILASQLRDRIGSPVVARLGQGIAKPGQSAPWTLNAVTDAEKAAAAAYHAKLTAPVSVEGF
jgi:hypothetical protein